MAPFKIPSLYPEMPWILLKDKQLAKYSFIQACILICNSYASTINKWKTYDHGLYIQRYIISISNEKYCIYLRIAFQEVAVYFFYPHL